MKKWQANRKEYISDHILVTQIICFFVFLMALFSFIKIDPNNALAIYRQILVAISLTGLLVVFYAGKRLVTGFTLGDKPTPAGIAQLLFTFLTAAGIIFLTGNAGSPVKIILLIPVIVAATSYGKVVGLITGGTASVLLFTLDFLAGFGSAPSLWFQADIVNSTVMLTLAWLIGGLADIEREVREWLTNLANTDELTGLSNHRHFQECLRERLNYAKEKNRPLSLIMFDIDYFKFYNDSFSHQKGDEVLKQIGLILGRLVKPPNISARYGGDEFVVIIPDTEEKALETAEEIRAAIESHAFEGMEIQPKGKVTISVGVAGFPGHGQTPKELIRSADEAMYKAKYGRNRVQLYFSVMDDLREGIAESERDLFSSIKTLITIINAKDRYTFGHSERVTYYSLKLAERLNLSGDEMISLRYGSFLHDIGKIEIDRDLLNKVGPLKPKELAMLQKHPVWGSDIVRPISSLKKAIPVIFHHHENFDGTGYPSGLAGEGIPLLARILRIADSFDAMTTDRPYKKAKTIAEACADLKSCSGAMFDPALVDLFVQLILEENDAHPAFKYHSSF